MMNDYQKMLQERAEEALEQLRLSWRVFFADYEPSGVQGVPPMCFITFSADADRIAIKFRQPLEWEMDKAVTEEIKRCIVRAAQGRR